MNRVTIFHRCEHSGKEVPVEAYPCRGEIWFDGKKISLEACSNACMAELIERVVAEFKKNL